ncbi:N-acetylmuramoyl-L-alanine amidase, partial [Paenibacillus riograndensis]
MKTQTPAAPPAVQTRRLWLLLTTAGLLLSLMSGTGAGAQAVPGEHGVSGVTGASGTSGTSATSGTSRASGTEASPKRQQMLGHDQRIILIDAGHGGIDGGTSHGPILEKDITLAISRRLFLLLRSDGFDAILNRTGDYAPSDENRWLRSSSRHMKDLAQRKELAETLPANVVVSIHINWARSPAKQGPLV